jgi:hypothetical protein
MQQLVCQRSIMRAYNPRMVSNEPAVETELGKKIAGLRHSQAVSELWEAGRANANCHDLRGRFVCHG